MAENSRYIGAVTLAVVTVVAGCSAAGAADFTLSTHDGKALTLSDEQGKSGVLLMFFASWCEQSAKQIDSVKAFVEQAADHPVKVIGVSLQEDGSTIEAFIKKRALNYPVVLDSEMTAARSFAVEGIPTFVGVSIEGQIVFRGHAIPEDPKELIKELTDAR